MMENRAVRAKTEQETPQIRNLNAMGTQWGNLSRRHQMLMTDFVHDVTVDVWVGGGDAEKFEFFMTGRKIG